MSGPTVWHEFAHDPRDPSHAALRAADADRDVVRGVLGDAYAEGKLDLEEFDERTDAVTASRTLGELPAIIDDLVPTTSAAAITPSTPEAVQARAVARYERSRREAVWQAIAVSTLCWVIWLMTSFDPEGFDANFPWPVFVMLGTGLNAGRIVFNRRDILAEEVRRIEKKDRKELEAREIKELERRERNRALGHGDPHSDPHGRREPDED